MAVSKPGRKSDWKDGFLFLGNHLALDFLNTRPIQNSETVDCFPISTLSCAGFGPPTCLVLVRRPVFGNCGENQPEPSMSWKPCGNCEKG